MVLGHICPWNPAQGTGVCCNPCLRIGVDLGIPLPGPLLSLVAQSGLTLVDPMDCSPPGSSVHGILHVRILEWVAMPSSRGSSQPRDRTQVSLIAGRFFTQNSIPILNFFRPESPVSPALASGFFITETLGKPLPPHQMMLIGICLN